MAKKRKKTNFEFMRTIVPLAMRPFVCLMIRYGITFAVFSAIVKETYVDVAANDFTIPGRKQSHARIALLTGLTRREVKSTLEEQCEADAPQFSFNRAARVFSGWLQDQEFSRDDGQPKTLSTAEKGKGSFDALATRYGGDITPRALLDELLQQGAIESVGDGAVSLVNTGYTPKANSVELLRTGFRNLGDLIRTIDHNDQNSADQSRLQLVVDYDNVNAEGVEVFRLLSREKSKELMLYLDRFLATQDRDSNLSLHHGRRARTGLGLYYFEESLPDSQSDEDS